MEKPKKGSKVWFFDSVCFCSVSATYLGESENGWLRVKIDPDQLHSISPYYNGEFSHVATHFFPTKESCIIDRIKRLSMQLLENKNDNPSQNATRAVPVASDSV